MFKYIIFDWKRTLYDPDQKTLIPGSLELLELINSKHISMILIGKGGEDMKNEVNRLGLKKYFKNIIFNEGTKDISIFRPYVANDKPQASLFIGDRTKSELEIGKKLGATTIWVKQGKFADELPENDSQKPDFTVGSLGEALQLFKKLVFERR